MQKEDPDRVEVWSTVTNGAVVRMPGRRYPGVVIQGDSLSILFDRAMWLVERAAAATDEEALDVAVELAEQLHAHVLCQPVRGETASTKLTWAVWRQDDNGNQLRISGRHTSEEAERLRGDFEARGHKQVHWISPEDDADELAPPGKAPRG